MNFKTLLQTSILSHSAEKDRRLPDKILSLFFFCLNKKEHWQIDDWKDDRSDWKMHKEAWMVPIEFITMRMIDTNEQVVLENYMKEKLQKDV